MTTLPREIVRFILTSVPSVPYLEAMLVMRNEPDIVWTCHDLAQRLYLTDKKAKTLLDALVDAEIAVRIDADPHQYRYQPDTLLQDRLDELADIYARNLIEVTQLIHAKADRRAEQFADAFKWHQTRKI